jgi:hypothetical protein
MAAPQATKGTVLELVMLALANSPLKEMGLDAMRSVLKGDPRLAVINGAFDLQPIWDLFESQEGFDPEAARPPFCFLKSLETKLAVSITFPQQLEALSPAERTRYAGLCMARRDEVEKILATPITDEAAQSGMARPSKQAAEPQAGASWAPKKQGRKINKTMLAVISGVLCLAGMIFLTVYLINNGDHTPSFSKMDTEWAGAIPLASAEKWATEVHAVFSDTGWLSKVPEEERKRQMTQALQKLAEKNLSVLIVEDDTKKVRASAQYMGKPPAQKIVVRFY